MSVFTSNLSSTSLSTALTASPFNSPTFNSGTAEAFSWVEISGAGRPLYAKATYLTNASDISINANSINLSVEGLEEITNKINDEVKNISKTQEAKYEQIITLLTAITGISIQVDLSTDQIQLKVDGVENLLDRINKQLTAQNQPKNFVFVEAEDGVVNGNFNCLKIVEPCRFNTIKANNSTTTGMTKYEFSSGFILDGDFTSFSLKSGAVLAYIKP